MNVRFDRHPYYWGKSNSCSKPPTRYIYISWSLQSAIIFERLGFLNCWAVWHTWKVKWYVSDQTCTLNSRPPIQFSLLFALCMPHRCWIHIGRIGLEVEHVKLTSVLTQTFFDRSQRLIHWMDWSSCAAHPANVILIGPCCKTLVWDVLWLKWDPLSLQLPGTSMQISQNFFRTRNCMGWHWWEAGCLRTHGLPGDTLDGTCRACSQQHSILRPNWHRQPQSFDHSLVSLCGGYLLRTPIKKNVAISGNSGGESNPQQKSQSQEYTKFDRKLSQKAFISWPTVPATTQTLPRSQNPCALIVLKKWFAHFTM